MTKTELAVINFFKAAFCVDGKVKILTNHSDFKVVNVIELNDSKRGKFYVGKLEVKE